jgi:hypothetical protein
VKPRIQFRAMVPPDYEEFTRATSYYPGPQFGGIVAWSHADNGVNTIMGMVGLDAWTPATVSVHWCIRHPRCIEPLWRELVAYGAMHGKKKFIGTTPSDNKRALRMIFRKLGWQPVAVIKDGWDVGVDIVISEFVIPAQAVRIAA